LAGGKQARIVGDLADRAGETLFYWRQRVNITITLKRASESALRRITSRWFEEVNQLEAIQVCFLRLLKFERSAESIFDQRR